MPALQFFFFSVLVRSYMLGQVAAEAVTKLLTTEW
jgi:hypothetical protein